MLWRQPDWTLLALALFLTLYLFVAILLVFRAVGDVRQLVTFSPISTDESRLVKMVSANLQAGQFGAHRWYDYGGFYFMLCLAVAYPAQAFMTLTEPTILILSRLVSVWCGAASLVILYLCGRKLFDRVTALLAVVAMGVSWVFVVWSVSDHPDVPQVLFVLLALLGCVFLTGSPSAKWLFFASLCAGLAFSIKYVGLFMWPVIVLSLALGLLRHSQERSWKRRFWWFAGGSVVSGLVLVVVFFITTPYALTNLADFWERIQFTSEVASKAKFGVPVPGTVWFGEVASVSVLGVGLTVFALVYVLIFCVRYVRRFSAKSWLLDAQLVVIVWTALFLGYLYWQIDYHPPHYLLPILPGLCLLAAAGARELFGFKRRPQWFGLLVRAAVCVVFALSLIVRGEVVWAFALDRLSFSPMDTPLIQAGVWLERTFPPETKIGNDASYNYVPGMFKDVLWDDPAKGDVILLNRSSAGTFDSPDQAGGYVGGRETFLRTYEFYRTMLDPDRRPAHLLPIRDFGAVIVYLNADSILRGKPAILPSVAADGLVLPSRETARDAAYVFAAQDQQQISAFAKTWEGYATREEIRGLDGELLAVAFRVKSANLPNADSPLDVLQAPQFPLRPARLTQARFDGGLELLGYTVVGEAREPGQPLEVVLYWRGEGSVGADYTVFVHALDNAGRLQGVGDRQPLDGRYPTSRWKKGDVIIDRFTVPLNPCAASGAYNLEVGLYQPTDGKRLALSGAAGGTAVLLGPVDAQPAGTVSAKDLSPIHRADIPVPGQAVQLLGFDLERETAHAGQPVRVTLDWQATGDVSQAPLFSLALKPEVGQTVKVWDGPIAGGKLLGLKWQEGQAVCQPVDVRLPEALPPGRYEWVVQVGDWQTGLGDLTVAEKKGTFNTPAPSHPAKIALGNNVTYLGSDGLPESAPPGTDLHLTLYWQAIKAMDENYKVFLHLVGPEGKIAAQKDSIPLNGEYPTRDWSASEVVEDQYDLRVPQTAAPGEYRVLAGLYDEVTGQRLEIPGPEANSIVVGTVRVGS